MYQPTNTVEKADRYKTQTALKMHVCLRDLQSLHFSRFASVNTPVHKVNNHC